MPISIQASFAFYLRKKVRLAWLALAALLVAGCDVSDGTGLDRLELSSDGAAPRLFQCVYNSVQVSSVFDDGAVEPDTQGRATWKSSNPDVVRVSNGDAVSPSGVSLPKGTLSPVGQPGETATITVSLNGKTRSFEVEIEAANVELAPPQPQLAEGTSLTLRPTAILSEGGEQTINVIPGLVTFSVTDADGEAVEPGDNLITIDDEGRVTAVDNNEPTGSAIPLTISATTDMFNAQGTGQCSSGLASVLLTIRNETIQSLDVGLPVREAPVNHSQPVTVTGQFSNGYSQNVTVLSQLDTRDPANPGGGTHTQVAQFGLRGASVVTTSEGAEGQTTEIVASFDQGLGAAPVTASTELRVLEGSLQSLEVRPMNASMLPQTAMRFQAVGTYLRSNGQQQVEHDLTRSVDWSLAEAGTDNPPEPDQVSINNEPGSKGLVIAREPGLTPVDVIAELRDMDDDSVIARAETLLSFDAELNSLAIEGQDLIGVGQTVQLAAIANFSDGGTQDLAAQVVWSSSNPSVASVSNSPFSPGQLTGSSTGNTTITADYQGETASFAVEVQAQAPVSELEFGFGDTPPTLYQCLFSSVQASLVSHDGEVEENVQRRAEWHSSNPSVVRVSNGLDDETHSGLILPRGFLSPVGNPGQSATITATVDGVSESFEVTVRAAKLELAPPRVDMAEGTQVSLRPILVRGEDGVDGPATALNVVSFTVTDESGQVVENDDNLVTLGEAGDVNAVVTALDNDEPAGAVMPLTVTAATDMLNAQGTAHCANGTASIPLSVHNETIQSLDIGLQVPEAPVNFSQPVGVTGQFSGGFSQDLTGQATLDTQNPGNPGGGTHDEVAKFEEGSNVVTTSEGAEGQTTNIVASYDQGLGADPVTAATPLRVLDGSLDALEIRPMDSSMLPGTVQRFLAVGTYVRTGSAQSIQYDLTRTVNWSLFESGTQDEADPEQVSISNDAGSKGVVNAQDSASTPVDVVAEFSDPDGGSVIATTGLSFDAVLDTLSIEGQDLIGVGQQVPLQAVASFTNGDSQDLTPHVFWTSSNPNVASVSSSPPGRLTGISEGSATITAFYEGATASFPVTVQTEAPVPELEFTFDNGGDSPTLRQCLYSRARLSASYYDGTVDEDIQQQADWESSNPSVVRVSNGFEKAPSEITLAKGLLMPVGDPGQTATITASFAGVSESFDVIIEAADLELAPRQAQLAEGTQLTLRAVILQGSTAAESLGVLPGLMNFTAFDQDGDVVEPGDNLISIDDSGLVIALDNDEDAGAQIPLTIEADTNMFNAQDNGGLCESGFESVALTIRNETVQSLEIGLPVDEVPVHHSQPVSVTGQFTGDYSQDVTNLALLDTQDPGDPGGGTHEEVAQFGLQDSNVVTTTEGAQGQTTNIVASFNQGLGDPEVTASTPLMVLDGTLETLEIRPMDSSMLPESIRRFLAVGTYEPGDSRPPIEYDLTRSVGWSLTEVGSDAEPDPNRVSINNEGGRKGIVTARVPGLSPVDINVRFPEDDTIMAVAEAETGLSFDAVLDTLEINGQDVIGVGQTVQLLATANLVGGGNQDLTTQVIWSSSDPNVASVSNSPFSPGQMTGIAVGTAVITARYESTTATFPVTVQTDPPVDPGPDPCDEPNPDPEQCPPPPPDPEPEICIIPGLCLPL